MSAKNHHMKSLAHSPDIIGLFFSILNQFTSTSSFLHDGQLITIQTETFELQGHGFVSKLFCGVANWFGHIMSDVAGPSRRHDDLRMMLIIGDGTLFLMDGADAVIHSGGNWVNFFLQLNIVAWYRLTVLVFREVCIRAGISFPLQKQLDAFIRINEALTQYLSQLEQSDIERFRKETEQYNELLAMMERTNSENELNILLRNEYKTLGIQLPYDGDFDDFMNDSSSVLEFK